jgi:ATP/maltotriose-dependent transcriptional regulator MalT
VDDGDNDPAAFFGFLENAMQGHHAGRSARLPVFAPEYSHGIAAFTRSYSRNLFAHLGEGGFLVLDNFQDLSAESATHQVIKQFIAEIPPGINLLVLSRSEPVKEYLRYRANGSIAVLDWQDIALTEQESSEICRKRKKERADKLPQRYINLPVVGLQAWC